MRRRSHLTAFGAAMTAWLAGCSEDRKKTPDGSSTDTHAELDRHLDRLTGPDSKSDHHTPTRAHQPLV
jgi:hypothetical protein